MRMVVLVVLGLGLRIGPCLPAVCALARASCYLASGLPSKMLTSRSIFFSSDLRDFMV